MADSTRFIFCFLLGAFLSLPVHAQKNDWLIIPGQRLGPISQTTTRADLDQLFGKSNVRDQPVDSGEGPEPATRVFPAKPNEALTVYWAGKQIANILVCYPDTPSKCKWHTSDGITIGTESQRLQSLNGRPFQFVAWGSDAGGNITSWQTGKFASLFNEGATYKLWLTLDYPQLPDGPTPDQRKWVDKVNGRDNLRLSSQDAAVRHLKPTVTRLTLVFSRLQP